MEIHVFSGFFYKSLQNCSQIREGLYQPPPPPSQIDNCHVNKKGSAYMCDTNMGPVITCSYSGRGKR